jgi:hypothetical protein
VGLGHLRGLPGCFRAGRSPARRNAAIEQRKCAVVIKEWRVEYRVPFFCGHGGGFIRITEDGGGSGKISRVSKITLEEPPLG